MDPKPSLDSIDRHILEILQADASLSVNAIGERVGLSANPCWRRIRRLEEAGVIERRVAIVDQAAIGLPMTAFVSIRTDKHNAEWLDTFARGVRSIPEIVECHRMSGDVDYVLKVVVRDIAHYDRVYRRLIAEVPGLSDVSSTFSMERLKFSTVLDLRSGS
ncbi:MAG: Lrp/AsnC family transcriptional regulator [Chromatiales bacterium]|jgi:Lrp/AsnC family transcriptional regulator|nr:Lrp/AsnC family transcriptional regulator [Chromatiales bacterium]